MLPSHSPRLNIPMSFILSDFDILPAPFHPDYLPAHIKTLDEFPIRRISMSKCDMREYENTLPVSKEYGPRKSASAGYFLQNRMVHPGIKACRATLSTSPRSEFNILRRIKLISSDLCTFLRFPQVFANASHHGSHPTCVRATWGCFRGHRAICHTSQ